LYFSWQLHLWLGNWKVTSVFTIIPHDLPNPVRSDSIYELLLMAYLNNAWTSCTVYDAWLSVLSTTHVHVQTNKYTLAEIQLPCTMCNDDRREDKTSHISTIKVSFCTINVTIDFLCSFSQFLFMQTNTKCVITIVFAF